ncbi:aminotransferase class III-fold pyridoxal phosphate-dependent enzyme, partial [Pantoea sp. SIMBA_133]
MHDQVDKYVHTGLNVMMYEPYIELAEKLAALAPGNHPKKVLLQNSGAEAVENAVKIARKHTGRQAVVTFQNAFHGRTLMTMSMTSKVKPYKYGFGPFAPVF